MRTYRERTRLVTLARKSLFVALAAALAATLVPAAAQQTEPSSGYADPEIGAEAAARRYQPVWAAPSVDTLATIRRDGVLRVGVAVSEPAVHHDAEGNLVGFSVEIARQLADDLGVELQLVETSWSNIIPELVDGRFDLIASGLWMTPQRALVVNYTVPTAREGLYLVASRKTAAGKLQQSDFNRAGMRLAVYPGTVQERVARDRFPHATIVAVPEDSYDLEPVLGGRADAALVPSFAPHLYIENAPDKLYLPFEEPVRSSHTAMAVRKGDADFLNYLDTWVRIHRDDGWLEQRLRRWAANRANQ